MSAVPTTRIGWALRSLAHRLRHARIELRDIRDYHQKVREAHPRDVAGLPTGVTWHRVPGCLLRGHTFERDRYGFCINSWQLRFCTDCGMEIAGRVGWDSIGVRPADEPFDYSDYDDEDDR